MKKKKTFIDKSVDSSIINEPAFVYETKSSALQSLSDESIARLSADEFEDLSQCITGEELEARVIARLEKAFPNKSCK